MKTSLGYLIGMFPLLALLTVFVGNPYLTITLIALSMVIAIPVSGIAFYFLVNKTNIMWSMISLVCSSTAVILGLLVVPALIMT